MKSENIYMQNILLKNFYLPIVGLKKKIGTKQKLEKCVLQYSLPSCT